MLPTLMPVSFITSFWPLPAALRSSRTPAPICTILDKPSRRKADIQPDYEGFQVPDEFVVGYGLDYDEKYRNLPYVGVLKPEIYTK